MEKELVIAADYGCIFTELVLFLWAICNWIVKIGVSTWVGIGASVSNSLSVCSDCMVGAGAVVVKDIAELGTYVGVPATLKNE